MATKPSWETFCICGCLLLCVAAGASSAGQVTPVQAPGPGTIAPGLHTSADGSAFLYGGPVDTGRTSRKPERPGPPPYTASFSRDLCGGIEVTAAGSSCPLKLVPLSWSGAPGRIAGGDLEYEAGDGPRVIYSFKGNGVKEDIVLERLPSGTASWAFRLETGGTLDARLDRKGNLLLYGPDPVLAASVQAADDLSAQRLSVARRKAPKDHLCYVIPAPVVLDARGRRHDGLARFELEGTRLTLHTENLAGLPAPVTIDPSVVVTTTADFGMGNNEGMISFDTDAISRAVPSGGTTSAWSADGSFFSWGRWGHTSVAFNGYLYVIGGWNSAYLADVRFALINADGTIGTWNVTTALPTGRYLHRSVAYNGYLYVTGGYSGSSLNDVLCAPINANGTLGAWTSTTALPSARYAHACVAYDDRLYVTGGYNGSPLGDVQVASLNADGTIGAWTALSAFTTARSGHTSVAYNGHLYVIGGSSGVNLDDVQYAPIRADGTLGAWAATSSFTTARSHHASVAYNGYLYVIGGGAYLNDVQCAPINANGTLGAWASSTNTFTTGRFGLSSVAYNGRLYVLGGQDSGSLTLNDVQHALIDAGSGAGGTLGAWAPTTSFTAARDGHASVAYRGYLYVTGGYNGSYLNDVQYAPINADGTTGAWTATTSFTTPRVDHTSVAYKGYLYVIGGYGGSALNNVQYAPINADGSVGTWSATTGFSTARYYHTSVACNGYLYVIGGYGGSALSDVQYAPINADGTIGAWSATTSFTTARYRHTSVAYNGYLYVIGGNGGSYLSSVQYAPLNANGAVGAWTTTTSLPAGRQGHASVATNGHLYVIGGENGTYLSDVQIAPINSNGSAGAWSATTSFATARYLHASTVYEGYLYLLGGSGGSYLNDVQYATIEGPAARGRYSRLVDLGTDQIVDSIGFDNSAYKGATNLAYAIAPSGTAVFGARTTIPNAATGAFYTAGLGTCARWLWASFDLDDTQSATLDAGGLNGRGDVWDFTVNHHSMDSPSAPGVADVDPCLQNGVSVSWGTVTGAASYDLQVDGSTVVTGVTSPYAYSPGDGAVHDYQVRALSAACVSAWSTPTSGADGSGIPAAPGAPGVADIDSCTSGVSVSWIPVSGATGYDLLVDATTVTSVTSPYTYLPGDTLSHNYEVRSKNACNASAWSSPTAGTDVNAGVAAPSAPGVADISACAQSGVSVTWGSVTGATGYDLQVDGTTTVAGVTSPYSYNPGDTSSHTYAVRGKNATCTGAWSSTTARADVNQTPPSVGTLTIQKTGNDMVVSWLQVADPSLVDYYEVTRSLSPSGPFDTSVGTASGIVHGLILNLLTEPASAYYKVRAVKGTCPGPLD